ncbi:MAG: LD-carboxypeptidase [Holophagales bacterium]|nr:LD-carboxypeptidase [Holophagales bacterium]MYG31948.1 LD-carboxypeptidase [Holophagales bacterium]MYI79019.1 LD-carboxypeptidase [Holophagales bacterium]
MTLHPGSSARRPPLVVPGDRVGIAALSGRIEAARLSTGVAALEELGFSTVVASNLRSGSRLSGRPLFAGSDAERLDAFHELVADESVAAIVFARGGYGVTRILEQVDWALLASRPRAYVGYSDLAPLLLGLVARTGMVAFHGPMVVDFERGLLPEERQSFLGALAGERPPAWPLDAVAPGLSAGRPRVIEGRLLGGCLSMLAATVGTGLLPSFEDSILVLEDIDEPEYRIDRLLTQLRTSGQAAGVRAVIAGHFTNCDARASLIDFADSVGVPLFGGLPAGHEAPNHTFPLGARIRLDAGTATLEIVS